MTKTPNNAAKVPINVGIGYCTPLFSIDLQKTLAEEGCYCFQIATTSDLENKSIGLLLLCDEMLATAPIFAWRECLPDAIFLAVEAKNEQSIDADLLIPANASTLHLSKLLRLAAKQWSLRQLANVMEKDLAIETEQINQLTSVGIALSAEKDLGKLLHLILREGQRLAACDAASLFLVHGTNGDIPELVFKLTQNFSVDFPFREQSVPMDMSSIAGYVALTNREVNLDDVYHISDDVPYRFNRSFDEKVGYRTKSMIAIPMRNNRQEVVGVLEFINRKTNADVRLVDEEITLENTTAFDDNIATLLRALASQAAVAIENSVLLANIKQLFDGFVHASVAAIEQRDPSTMGHSFRVADLTTGLALALPNSDVSMLKNTSYSESQMREIRYACLLHDFGKVGVREDVLTKPKKLTDYRLDTLRYRVALEKERLRSQALTRLLYNIRQGEDINKSQLEMEQCLAREIASLDDYLAMIESANEPTVLPEGSFQNLMAIKAYPFTELDGGVSGLINESDFLALSVRKGSLTKEERREIESHVVHTLRFLELIPWTPELKSVPHIAGAHHEKLDGTGYPLGLSASEIPLPSKMMTVSDIYDALTAADRPYKTAVPVDRALGILEAEAKAGLLDNDLVNLFVDAKVYMEVENKEYGSAFHMDHPGFAHHVCDFDLEFK